MDKGGGEEVWSGEEFVVVEVRAIDFREEGSAAVGDRLVADGEE